MTDGIIGTPNADTLAGTEADDIMVGGGDNDVIDGGAGNDSIRGDGDSDGGSVEIRDFIVNGSFEQVADGSGNPTMVSTYNSNHDDVHDRSEVGFYEVVPGWQTSGDNIEIHGDQTGISNSPAALDGHFKLEIDGGGTDPFFNNSNVFQNIDGMLEGETYQLNFNLLNRECDPGDVVKVYFGGEKIAVIEQTAAEWCEYGYEVTGGAGDGSDQLEFRIWTYDEHAIFIDSVSLVGPANVAVEDVPGDDVIAGGLGDDTIDGEAGNDSIDGGEGADLIDGGAGNDTLSGGADGAGEGSGGEEVCAENGVTGFEAVGVSLSALDFDGSPAVVTDTSQGIGVAGGNPVGDQINHTSDGQTQTLIVDLGQAVDSATLTVTRMFPDEGTGGEAGQWRALDVDGNEVATGTFGPDDVITDHELGDIPAVGRFTIDGIGEFATIELSALPYADGDVEGATDSSDYFLHSIKFTTATVADDCGDGDSDTIHGGIGDDEINGNGGDDVLSGDAGDDLIAGGAGNDSIDGGTGDDTIFGDGGSAATGGVQEIVIPQGENGLHDVAGRDSVTLTMDFLGGSAGFNNSFGFYLADESGNPVSGEIVKADVKTSDAAEGADVLSFTLNAAQLGGAAQLGMFLIPNGGSLNPGLADGDAVTFADNGNGLTMHYLEAGDPKAPLVLLLHGFPELAYSWRKIMPTLADEGYHVIAPDQRGYGLSTGWDADYHGDLASFRFINLLRDILGLLSAMDIERIEMLVGHDFGSFAAAHAALIRPDIFRKVVLMSAPFSGPPPLKPQGPVVDIDAALAARDRPRKHYHRYYSTPEANADMHHCPQGVHDFMRAYYHHKSADWTENRPFPLRGWTAPELAKMPTYYIMDLDRNMAETVAPEMPLPEQVAACRWLPEDELRVYSSEYARNGFQGGLQWYRCTTDPEISAELRLFAGRTIDVPSLFIGGKSDWGTQQRPGAIEAMQVFACTDMRGCHLVPGAGHWVQQEQPLAVTRRLLEFLASF